MVCGVNGKEQFIVCIRQYCIVFLSKFTSYHYHRSYFSIWRNCLLLPTHCRTLSQCLLLVDAFFTPHKRKVNRGVVCFKYSTKKWREGNTKKNANEKKASESWCLNICRKISEELEPVEMSKVMRRNPSLINVLWLMLHHHVNLISMKNWIIAIIHTEKVRWKAEIAKKNFMKSLRNTPNFLKVFPGRPQEIL